MEAASQPRRPAGVTAVGVILYVVALLNLLVGVAMLAADALSEVGEPLHDYEVVVAIMLIAWGVIQLFIAAGITRGSNFARLLWVILMAFELLAGVTALVQDHLGVGFVATILPLFLMYLVFTPAAEAFFNE